MTDRQTDRWTGGVAISPIPGPTAPAGDKNPHLSCLVFWAVLLEKNLVWPNDNTDGYDVLPTFVSVVCLATVIVILTVYTCSNFL